MYRWICQLNDIGRVNGFAAMVMGVVQRAQDAALEGSDIDDILEIFSIVKIVSKKEKHNHVKLKIELLLQKED